jgi:hypothetical protein
MARWVRVLGAVATILGLLAGGTVPAAGATAAAGVPPVWAEQFPWAPSSASIQINYDSSDTSAPLNGAYDATTAVFPTGLRRWQQYTWTLTSVDLAGAENFGADLRLAAAPGIAVHRVVLSLEPPGSRTPGPEVSITLDSGHIGVFAENSDHGLTQLALGGSTGDSEYTVGTVAGKGAEILTTNTAAGPGAPSYIYLRVSRQSALYRAAPHTLYATVTFAATAPPAAWSEATFARLAARGIHYAELNMEWGAVEPTPGHFNFQALDADLRHAAAAGVRIIPIFWYAVWTGNPAPWITQYDVGSSGAVSQVPTWWSPFNRAAYFHYVVATVAHIKDSPAFGGVFLDYGWLDYMWGPPPGGQGVNGYAPQDIARFHAWLPTRYGTLAAFNRAHGTDFRTWGQVPAAVPGEPLFSVYQHFRSWSVAETYSRLSALVRAETAAPIYYYWGGGFGGAGVAFNLPDTFFQVARRFHATVVLDDADHTGLALLFGSLARAYGVRLFEEWTPRPSGLHAEIAEFLGHYGFGAPEEVGMDFFLYHGGEEYSVGFPAYVRWIPVLSAIHGSYPLQAVAVYISYAGIFQDPGALAGLSERLAGIWRNLPLAFTVVTDRELAAGVVHLRDFRAVLPLNGRDGARLAAYRARGGRVLDHSWQLAQVVSPYLTLSPQADVVEAVPTVDRAARTAWITLSAWEPTWQFRGVAIIRLRGLGLPAGTYHVVDAATGAAIPSYASPGELRVPLRMVPGDFAVWEIRPGPGPRLPAPPQASGTLGGVLPYFGS